MSDKKENVDQTCAFWDCGTCHHMGPPFFISKVAQQFVDLWHSVGLKLRENEFAVEHDLEGTGRPK